MKHNPFISGNSVTRNNIIGRNREIKSIIGRIATGNYSL